MHNALWKESHPAVITDLSEIVAMRLLQQLGAGL
jgi:hypothetical protein